MLRKCLANLESSGFVRPALAEPELEYLFRHVLLHEATYEGLLLQERRRLHRRIGEALERLRPGDAETAPLLARHFAEAGDARRAWRYYTLAGDTAFGRYANTEAEMLYAEALGHAGAAEATTAELEHLYLRRGRALELNSQWVEALACYQGMTATGKQRGERRMELASLVAQATIFAAPSSFFDIDKALRLCDEALALARELGDHATEARIYWNEMLASLFADRAEAAAAAGEKSLAIARQHGLREQIAYTQHDLFRAYLARGDEARGWAALQEAQQLWEELGNQVMLADNLATTALHFLLRNDFEQVAAYSERALALSEANGNLWGQSYGRFALGIALWMAGRLGEAVEVLEECIRLGELAGFFVPSVESAAYLALTYAELGARELALRWAQSARDNSRVVTPMGGLAPLAAMAVLHAQQGEFEEAEALLAMGGEPAYWQRTTDVDLYFWASALVMMGQQRFEEVLRLAELGESMMRPRAAPGFLASALLQKGRALWALKRPEEARAALEEARALAAKQGSLNILRESLVLLCEVQEGLGNGAAAEGLRREAAALVRQVAEGIRRPELKASFLGREDLRPLLEEGVNQ